MTSVGASVGTGVVRLAPDGRAGAGRVAAAVGRRLGQAVVVLWAAYTASFALLYLLPTDPVATMLGRDGQGASVDPSQVAALRHELGFDRPVAVQYLTRLGAALHGDLGRSVSTGQSVTTELAQALPSTLALGGAALALALLLAFGVAVAATSVRRPWLRSALSALPPLGVAIPTFWFALVVVQLVSFRLRLLPAYGSDGWVSLVLPAVTLAVPVSAGVAQVLSQSLQATWDAPHVATARATGAPRPRLLLRTVLRNAAPPAVAVLGVTTGAVLAGSVVTETVFARPGLGRLAEQAVSEQDIPLVQGVVLLAAAVFVTVNLLVDVAVLALDPRRAVAS